MKQFLPILPLVLKMKTKTTQMQNAQIIYAKVIVYANVKTQKRKIVF